MLWTRFFGLFLLIICKLAAAPVLEYENQKIEKLCIILHSDRGILYNNLSLKSSLITKEGSLFSQSEFDTDLKNLSEKYDRIEPSIKFVDDLVELEIELWTKPKIKSISWCGNEKINTSTLTSELAVAKGSAYDSLKFNESFNKLKNFYIKKGYFESELDYTTTLLPETNEVCINIEICEGRSGKIQKISFVNFCEEEEEDILKSLITKKYNIFTSWITEEGIYNEEAVEHDRLVITNYLQNRGFADAQVDLNVCESTKKKDRIEVTFTADRGEQYFFGDITFKGNTIISDEVVASSLTICRGNPYSLEELRDTIDSISDAYGSLGYIDAIIDFEISLNDECRCYNVNLTIEEGEKFHVGLLKVFGNCVTKTSAILHETLIIPGELFNIKKLKDTESRLMSIGYFKSVNVYFVKGTDSALGCNYRDVYIEVEETGTGQFSGFLGYSSAEEIFGGINITEKNFNYEGFYYYTKDGMCAFRGGGEFAHFTAQIGQKSSNYTISWTKPYFMDTDWTIGFDLNRSCAQYISSDYEIETLSLILRAHYNVNSFLRFGTQYRLKNGNLHVHNGANVSQSLRDAANLSDLISAVGVSLNYDTTNSVVRPTSGFRSKLLTEYAGLGGAHTFFSVGYYNSYYRKFGKKAVVRYRADFRFIQPLFNTHYKDLPVDERIFMGGEFNIRGYRPYRLGPKFPPSKDDSSSSSHGNKKQEPAGGKTENAPAEKKNESGSKDKKRKKNPHIPAGGISLQYFSVELSRPLTDSFEGFAFIDAGYLSDKTWDFGGLDASIGFGLNCKIIPSIPPITVGFGYPIQYKSRSDIKRFFMAVGGTF